MSDPRESEALKPCPFGCSNVPYEWVSWGKARVCCYGDGATRHLPITMLREDWQRQRLHEMQQLADLEAVREACAAIAETAFVDPRWNALMHNAGLSIGERIRNLILTKPGETM